VLLVLLAGLNLNAIYGFGALREAALVVAPLHSGPSDENAQDVETALALRTTTSPAATFTVTRAGTMPYFADGRPAIDLLGKTDRYVAHEPMRPYASGLGRFTEFRPGHMKFDYSYSIGQLRPDVIVQLWTHTDEGVRSELHAQYRPVRLGGRCVYLRTESDRVMWERISQPSCVAD
jgi:hypothetical protein